jgi:two-component system response regulator FixJ
MSSRPVEPAPDTSPLACVVAADARLRDRVAAVLGRLGAGVQSFGSGHEFLASLAMAVPACVVADSQLPDMTGLALLEELRARGLKVPTILLTSEADINGAVTAMRAGAVDVIEKPYIDRTLALQVAPLLGLDARNL